MAQAEMREATGLLLDWMDWNDQATWSFVFDLFTCE